MEEQLDPNMYTHPYQLTKTMHREPYYELHPVNPKNLQNGKIVIITGAYGGIGKAAAAIWARAGASVVLAGIEPGQLVKVGEEAMDASTNPSAKVIIIPVDITIEPEVKHFYDQVQNVFGRSADTLVNNSGVNSDFSRLGQVSWDTFTSGFATHYLGAALMSKYFISSQPDPEDPTGTIIYMTSVMSCMLRPGFSSYSIAKLAGMRLIEYLDAEYPRLRAFSLSPGITLREDIPEPFKTFARDHVDMPGLWTVYLSTKRADYLRGGFVGINWDVEELEKHKDEIVDKKLLKLRWIRAKMSEEGYPWEE